jgi:hypothetical protein
VAEDYAQDVLDAEADIRESGELVSVTYQPGTVPNAAEPWKEALAAELEWEDVPVLYIPNGSSEALSYMKGSDIPEGAQVALIPGNVAFVPRQEMVFHSVSRGKMKLDKILDTLAPGPVVIMYTVRLVQ